MEKSQPSLYTSDEWDVQKFRVMQDLIDCKSDPVLNPELAARLEETGDIHIEETNWWSDTCWGCQLDGVGDNNLGQLIMTRRHINRFNGRGG